MAEKERGAKNLRIAIDRMGAQQVELFQLEDSGEIKREKVARVGKGLSGAGLGLEYFRNGQDFEVETIGGEKRVLSFPGFGRKFNTIQLEINRQIRYSPQHRQALGLVLGEIASEFKEQFSREDF